MSNQGFSSAPIKYQSADNGPRIYRQIREKATVYFSKNGNNRRANSFFWLKLVVMLVLGVIGYSVILCAAGFGELLAGYLIFGFAMLLLSMNTGHDAAHHAVTGNVQSDNRLFRLVFALQGLSGYLWQIRHNHSHHVLPNVHEQDSDLELGGLIILDRHDKVKPIHRYQHLYAPVLYMFATLVLFFYQDYEMLDRRKHGNLRMGRIPPGEWLRFAFAKTIHLGIYLGLPLYFGATGNWEVAGAFILMHFTLSLFMMFTFVISHHVEEVPYVVPLFGNIVDDTWVHHQITTTIDFNENSRFANFIFGGFNLHVAHHLFPEVSHVHYPALTRIVRETLVENGCSEWYKSFSFWQGCRSHLRHLRSVGQQQPKKGVAYPEPQLTFFQFSEN